MRCGLVLCPCFCSLLRLARSCRCRCAAAAPSPGKVAIEPTKVGQPSTYSKAIGPSFKVTMAATPTDLQARDLLTLTVRVTPVGRWQAPPQRPDLRKMRAFTDRFLIQRDPPRPDRELRDPPGWEFTYALRPRSSAVTEVPMLPFVYYKPGSIPPEKGYRTADTDPIPLTVKAPIPAQDLEPIQGPDAAFQIIECPLPPSGASRNRFRCRCCWPGCCWRRRWSAPPGICSGAGSIPTPLAWPGTGAAWPRKALHALHATGRGDSVESARRTATILADYLRHRLDLPGGEATPVEVADHLRDAGYCDVLAGKAAEFFRAAMRPVHAGATGRRFARDRREPDPCPGGRDVVFSYVLIGLLVAAPTAAAPERSSADLLRQAESAFQEGLAGATSRPRPASSFGRRPATTISCNSAGSAIRPFIAARGTLICWAAICPGPSWRTGAACALAPNDRAREHCLAYARDQVIYPAASPLGRPALDHWPPWLPRPTRWPLVGAFAVLYVLGWLCLTAAHDGHSRTLWLGGLAFAAAVLPAAVWGFVDWNAWRDRRHPLVVVARDDTRLYKGNGFDYPFSHDAPLNRGVEARQLFVRGDWLQVELADGEVGWAHRGAVLVDEP